MMMKMKCRQAMRKEYYYHIWSCQSGFTLLGVLFLMVIMGISIMGASKYTSTIVKREKETALLFRGEQIRKGIESYYLAAKSGPSKSYPRSLNDLLKDPRSMTVKRHLRKIYRDPMTADGEWGLVVAGSGRIKGVYSKSTEKPLKIANFPEGYEIFEKAKNYSDWRFVYNEKTSKK